MKLDAKEILKPALLLFVICVCITALLAGTNKLTAAKIAQNAVENEEASRQTVLPDADEFKTEDDCAVGYKDGKVIGYVYVTSAKGYGGDVQIMTGITTDGTISGVVVLDHDETPGLGANCEKESFRSQYMQSVPADGFTVVKNQTAGEGEIEALTGATISSRAVTDAVNEAVAMYAARN